jgi:hypothetical protein
MIYIGSNTTHACFAPLELTRDTVPA